MLIVALVPPPSVALFSSRRKTATLQHRVPPCVVKLPYPKRPHVLLQHKGVAQESERPYVNATNPKPRLLVKAFVVLTLVLPLFSQELLAMTPARSAASETARVLRGSLRPNVGFHRLVRSRWSEPNSWRKSPTRLYGTVVKAKASKASGENKREFYSSRNHQLKELNSEKKYDDAIKLCKSTIKESMDRFGENNLPVARFYLKLADLRVKKGQHEKEVRCCRDALRMRETALKEDHQLVAAALERFAKALERNQELEEAIVTRLRELKIREAMQKSKPKAIARLYAAIAANYKSLDDHAAAKEFAMKGSAIKSAALLEEIGREQVLNGNAESGLQVLDLARKAYADVVGEDHVWTQKAKQTLEEVEGTSDNP